MFPFKKILCPTDFSELSHCGLRMANEMARQFGSELILVNVHKPIPHLPTPRIEASETTFDYVVGGGMDWPVASIVAMDFQVQYMPIDFSEELIGVRDYSSFTITVGVKYLFSFDKK